MNPGVIDRVQVLKDKSEYLKDVSIELRQKSRELREASEHLIATIHCRWLPSRREKASTNSEGHSF